MEQRRKIIIPTGTDPEETLSPPHFDSEATLAAQRVVPLADEGAPPKQHANAVTHGAPSAPRAASSWKPSTLIVIVLVAVGMGVASGLAIGLYQSRRKPPVPVVAQPTVSEARPATVQQQPEPTPEPTRVKQAESEAEAQTPAAPPAQETKKDSANEPQTDGHDNDNKQVARANSKRTEEQVPPATVPDRSADNDPVADERQERRERRREERRRQREEDADAPADVPRPVERMRRNIDRLREIFEGRQP